MKKATNSKLSAKKKRKPTPASFKPGKSGNPYGRPKDDESWAGVIRMAKNATADELAQMVGGQATDLGRAFLQMPKNVQMKYLVTLRGLAGFMFEPTASIWNTIMDRDEGKVQDNLNLNVKEPITFIIKHDDKPRISDTPGRELPPETTGSDTKPGEA